MIENLDQLQAPPAAPSQLTDASTPAEGLQPAAPPLGVSVLLLACDDGAEFAEAVTGWLDLLRGLGRPFEMLIVDDASMDGTATRADELAARCPEVRVLHHARRQGLGASLRTGLAEAQQPLLFMTLANKQYSPADFGQFLDKIGEVDVAAGCRMTERIPWWLRTIDFCHRWFCQLVFGLPVEPRVGWLGFRSWGRRFLARWLFGVHFRDPECVYGLYHRKIFERIPIQSDGAFALVEILAKANFLVEAGVELPVRYRAAPGRGTQGEEARSFFGEAMEVFRHPDFGSPSVGGPAASELADGKGSTTMFRLSDIAHGRSGDKGNHANIAVIAYTSAGYAWLKEHLTADRVKTYFSSMHPGAVERFEAANVFGLNFLMRDILHGGASQSLSIDTQGKTLALTLLQMSIERPTNWTEMVRGERAAELV